MGFAGSIFLLLLDWVTGGGGSTVVPPITYDSINFDRTITDATDFPITVVDRIDF